MTKQIERLVDMVAGMSNASITIEFPREAYRFDRWHDREGRWASVLVMADGRVYGSWYLVVPSRPSGFAIVSDDGEHWRPAEWNTEGAVTAWSTTSGKP